MALRNETEWEQWMRTMDEIAQATPPEGLVVENDEKAVAAQEDGAVVEDK